MALTINDYAFLDTPIFQNYAGIIKIVNFDQQSNSFVCTHNGVHYYNIETNSQHLYSIPVSEGVLLKAGFVKIDANSINQQGEVFAFTSNQTTIIMQHFNNDWILHLPAFNNAKLNCISSIDEIQHHVRIICNEELILNLLPTIINKKILHDTLYSAFHQKYTIAYHPEKVGLSTQNPNYINYDYLLLSSISTSNVISIDFSKFEKDECQIVISFGSEKILFQSNKSMAEIQAGNPAYNMISSSEQQVFNSLYNLIQSCIVESLKC